MQIENLFERDIFRPINGVVKADQLDDSSVWQELDEFVITQGTRPALPQVLLDLWRGHRPPPTIPMSPGRSASGFRASSAPASRTSSRCCPTCSRTARTRTTARVKQAVEFFESKIKDAMLLGDIKRAVASNTDVILFNIDSKADTKSGRDAILSVFLKVLNEMQGYSGDHPHIAHMERYLDEQGQARDLPRTPSETPVAPNGSRNGMPTSSTGMRSSRPGRQRPARARRPPRSGSTGPKRASHCPSRTSASGSRSTWTRKGPEHRLIFLVDEVGQFIGTDTHLMLNLQTITEESGHDLPGPGLGRRHVPGGHRRRPRRDEDLRGQRLLQDSGPLQDPPVALQCQRR